MKSDNLEVKMVAWQLTERDNLAGQVLSETLFTEQEIAEEVGNEMIQTHLQEFDAVTEADPWTTFPDGSRSWSYGTYSLTVTQREILG